MLLNIKNQISKIKSTIQNLKFLIFTLSLCTLIFALYTIPAYAQTPVSSSSAAINNYQLPVNSYQLPPTVSPISPLYTDLLVNNLFHTFSCLAVGQSVIGQPCLSYLQGVPVLSKTNTSGGVLGTATSLIGMLYTNPPVRTADYLGSLGEQFGVVKTANAQVIGSGSQVLNPILRLWQVSRNISYVLMIIIFVIIGIMIMFRHKINPQTVITVQAALPGLVIGLIMITFSFFLAGLISDMAFVGTNVVGYYFSAVRGHTNDPQDLVKEISNQNAVSLVSPLVESVNRDSVTDALSSVWNFFGGWTQYVLTLLATFTTVQLTSQGTEFLKAIPKVGEGIQAAVNILAGVVASRIPAQAAGIALSFIASIILIYSMFKLLMRLINNYISIIFLTITAPFQLLAAALPGRQGLATGWILNMLSNVLAFPAVLAVLYFVAFLIGPKFLNEHCGIHDPNGCPFKVSYLNQAQDNNLVYAEERTVSIVGTQTFPLLGGFTLDILNLLLAFGALIALPAVPDIIGKAVGRMGQAGQLIGQEIGGSVGQGRQYAGQFQQGVGAISQQGARARGLFDTPVYTISGYGKDGKPVYELSQYQSTAGAIGKAKTWWKNRNKPKGE